MSSAYHALGCVGHDLARGRHGLREGWTYGERKSLTSMFSMQVLRDLYGHMEWADAKVWHVALAARDAGRDARLRDLLHHLHEVQRAFLHVWTDRRVALRPPDEFPAIRDLLAWARPYYGEVARLLERLDDAHLAQALVLPWAAQLEPYIGRRPHTTTMAETMFQVTSHSTYHRAQVNTRLRELGAEPPLVDYIAWVWFGKPSAHWAGATHELEG